MNAYASHLPVLKAIGHQRPIRSVLEFGAGQYSTPLFLDRAHYPVMERLVSVEPDPGWREKVRQYVGPDKRLRLVAEWDGSLDYDLVFIDDGQRAEERVATIEAVAADVDGAWVVIHDFENEAYREASERIDRPALVYTNETPWTAVFRSRERDVTRT